MRKITAIIFCFIIFSLSITPLSVVADNAATTVVDDTGLVALPEAVSSVAEETQNAEGLPPAVVDKAGILTESQIQELTARLDRLRSTYNMDVSIVGVKNIGSTSGSSELRVIMNFADDYYDYNGYGCGANDDGIMLVVSKEDRLYHFTTHARGISVFNDDALIYLENEILSSLKNNNYYGAFMKFANGAEEILEMNANGETFRFTPKEKKMGLVFVFTIPLILALFLTFRQYKNMNDAVKRAKADEYAQGAVDLRVSRDIFLYSTVHKTPRPKSNSGGSSTHRSSSGRSHGGRGGRF